MHSSRSFHTGRDLGRYNSNCQRAVVWRFQNMLQQSPRNSAKACPFPDCGSNSQCRLPATRVTFDVMDSWDYFRFLTFPKGLRKGSLAPRQSTSVVAAILQWNCGPPRLLSSVGREIMAMLLSLTGMDQPWSTSPRLDSGKGE
ncbi:hypothetical protein R1flu_026995 [Riccia fluitans]|uniref:Uncharacterized protein n=1 Tax=Riccia fluitans TaxID=41844 RepID=A0ABD1XHH5_9MARC